MSSSELIIYQTEDGLTRINLRATEGTVWLTQSEMAELWLPVIPAKAASRKEMGAKVNRTPVSSSNLDSVGYKNGTLEIVKDRVMI